MGNASARPATRRAAAVSSEQRRVFENPVADAHERLPEGARTELSREEARARAWLADGEPRGNGLALIHRALGRAMEQSGSVEMMHGAAARCLVEAGDGLGALPRYQVAAAGAAGR